MPDPAASQATPPMIAIIGAGFCGTLLASHLLAARRPVRIALIDRTGRFAAGVAYGTTCPSHLLNVPAGRMSALDDDPGHFLRWASARDSSVNSDTFLPRATYRQYITEHLASAAASAPAACRLDRLPTEAISATPSADAVTIRLADGSTLPVAAAVLATGNFSPPDPARITPDIAHLYAADPWAPGALDLPPDAPAALIGTGLTMLDIALALRDRGHRAPILAVSRRGLVPQPYGSTSPVNLALLRAGAPTSARALLRAVRAEIEAHAARRGDWRDIVAAIRPATPDLWRALPEPERRRFLSRLRPYWDTHRHQAAPGTWDGVQAMVRAGQLRIRAARLLSINRAPSGANLTLRPRGSNSTETFTATRIINCTGPETDLRRVRDPLIESLRECGLIRPDTLGLGLDTDDRARLIGTDGQPSERLFALGPLRRGRNWENIAVPELRSEAASLATTLRESLRLD